MRLTQQLLDQNLYQHSTSVQLVMILQALSITQHPNVFDIALIYAMKNEIISSMNYQLSNSTIRLTSNPLDFLRLLDKITP